LLPQTSQFMYTAYVLRSEKKGKHYYGHSKNLENRLKSLDLRVDFGALF